MSNYFSGHEKKLLTWLLPVICPAFLSYYLLIPVLFDATLSFDLSTRLLIASASLLPLGILLGIPVLHRPGPAERSDVTDILCLGCK